MEVRLQKILSEWGIASRRQAEKMTLEGRVRVNGEIAWLGQKADPQRDRIEVDGARVRPAQRPSPLYLLLNKPRGVVSTCADPQGRRTVLDLLPRQLRIHQGLHPVGRLDVDSTGATILTNDGQLTFYLTHPRYKIAKTYLVWLNGRLTEAVLQRWRRGVMLAGKKTLPARVDVMECEGDTTLLQIVLREGRNRQIRRVAALLGYEVTRLHRTAIGSIQLQSIAGDSLSVGQYRFLEEGEVQGLKGEIHHTVHFASIDGSLDVEEHRL